MSWTCYNFLFYVFGILQSSLLHFHATLYLSTLHFPATSFFPHVYIFLSLYSFIYLRFPAPHLVIFPPPPVLHIVCALLLQCCLFPMFTFESLMLKLSYFPPCFSLFLFFFHFISIFVLTFLFSQYYF